MIGISNRIKSAVTTMKKDIITMKENITGVMETLETVKGDVETVKEDVKAMKEDIETVKSDVESVKEDIEDVRDNVEDIEDDIEDVKEDMEYVKSDIETVKSDMGTVKGDVMMVKSEVETVKNDIKGMKSDVDMVKNDTGIVRSEVETVSRCVDRVKNDVDSIKSELENVRETTEQDMETIKSNLTGFYIKLEQVQQMCKELPPSVTPPTPPSETPPTPPSQTPTPTCTPPSEPKYTCNGTSGWKRVAYLNMTDSSHYCPIGWVETDYSRRTCGRASTSKYTCDSAIFPVSGVEYTRVCGQVLGYQFAAISAFYKSSNNIESHYVNGLSLTHGSAGSREHIWTFAGGLAENPRYYPVEMCPCDGGPSPVPEFVGNDYFCESGLNGPWVRDQYIFYPNDLLWDGMNCLPTSNCCTLNGPYFVMDIGSSTTDDIEARICSVWKRRYSDVAIELVELYVQ